LEADEVVQNLEQTKDRYLTVLDTVAEREKSILQLETHVNKLYKANESEYKKNDKQREMKAKIAVFDQEFK
jgi:hypothetical protein